jgi:hypothetical protein
MFRFRRRIRGSGKYMNTSLFDKMMISCSLVVLTVAVPACDSGREEMHGLVYSDRNGLQMLTGETTSELVTWSSLDARCFPVALSPDGHELAYTRTGRDLWVADLDSGGSVALVEEVTRAENGGIRSLDWSTDGSWLSVIVTQADDEGRPVRELVRLLAIEVSERRIVELASGVPLSAWLPEGTQIAFVKQFGSGEVGLYLARPARGELRLLLEGLLDPFIAVSPRDGSLVVGASRTYRDTRGTLLMIDPADGSSVDLLQDYHGSGAPSWPAWSPDGARLAFLGCEPLPGEPRVCSSTLFIVHILEGIVEEISPDVGAPLTWSPNGEAIAFEDSIGDIYRISLEDRRTELVSDAPRCGSLLEWR